ncbi:MAG: serine hydrolase domain-containing protein [Limisphaerales bacterium]
MKFQRNLIQWFLLLLLGGWIVGDYFYWGRPSGHFSLINFAIYLGKIFLLLFVGASIYATARRNFPKVRPDTHDLEKRIDEIGAAYVTQRPKAALVIAVYQRGKCRCKGFGKVSEENPNPPEARTVFEIGSITKVFTGIALARFACAGAVTLGDGISRYLPDGAQTPKWEGIEITLKNLATHTSGLPRLPDNFKQTMKDPLNPYASYTTKDLYDDLAAVKLARQPGRRSVYSNYGFGLLGHILERKSGKTYEALIQETVGAPLGLRHTTTHLSGEQQKLLAPGHSPNGRIVPNWDGDTLAGCGRLYSNAEDLLKFIEANLIDADSRTAEAMTLARQVHFKAAMRDIGLGWQIEKGALGGPVIHWHNGGTGGYVSFIGFNRKNQTGVVVLSSYGSALIGDASTDKIGMNLLSLGDKVSLE